MTSWCANAALSGLLGQKVRPVRERIGADEQDLVVCLAGQRHVVWRRSGHRRYDHRRDQACEWTRAGIVGLGRVGQPIHLLRIKMGFPAEVFALAARPLIDGHAELVQMLPVAGSRRHGEPGGQLQRALATALRTLDYRRGQILPRGAPPEIVGAHTHRWTCAVFVAALLHDAARVCAGLRVWMNKGAGLPEAWNPAMGSMRACAAVSYRVETLSPDAAPDKVEPAVPLQLFERCLPPLIRTWLGEDATLMAELRSVLMGRADPASAIGALVTRATVGAGNAAKPLASTPLQAPVTDPAVERCALPAPPVPTVVEPGFLDDVTTQRSPLARQLMAWLKRGVRDGTLDVNGSDAYMHVVDEGLLLVSPRIFREFAQQPGRSVEPAVDVARQVQREVLREGWHLRADRGVNILCYELRRDGRGSARINGVVIREPQRFVDPLPPINTSLVRVLDAAGAAH